MATVEPASDTISSASADLDALRGVGPESPCPYLPDRQSRNEAYRVDVLDGALYERLLSRGFRRSGRAVYRPRCRGCRLCVSIRVPVESFLPSRSLRRVSRRNGDVRMIVGDPQPTPLKYRLYTNYLDRQQDETMSRDYGSFLAFLYDSPTETVEFTYILGARLIGASIADLTPSGLSSVYMYFDPDFRDRGLGTLSILREIAWCREQGLAYYFLGFHVAGSRTMDYKARFRPHERLMGDENWVAASA